MFCHRAVAQTLPGAFTLSVAVESWYIVSRLRCAVREILPPHNALSDRDLGVALTRNAEAVEDRPRRVGAVEGVEMDSGDVVIQEVMGRLAQPPMFFPSVLVKFAHRKPLTIDRIWRGTSV